VDGQLPNSDSFGKKIDIDVVEAAALAHDIGHPPFGHAGEDALNECMDTYGGFEGNAQTFRVLTKLSRYRPEFPGLNLTRATLNAVIKYPWFRNERPGKKWNYYSTERADYDFARKHDPGSDQSLEARIMEWSDDIAYGAHDIEDGVRAGLIPIDELVLGDGPKYKKLFTHLKSKFVTGNQTGLFQKEEDLSLALGVLCFGGRSLTKRFEATTEQRGELRRLTTLLHQRYLLGVSVSDTLSLSDKFQRELKVLKEIMGFFVFKTLVKNQEEQRKKIKELFQNFVEKGKKDRTIFGHQVQASLEHDEKICSRPPEENLARAAADRIATMTEDELDSRYQQLTGERSKSLVSQARKKKARKVGKKAGKKAGRKSAKKAKKAPKKYAFRS
jgi:dGTPase